MLARLLAATVVAAALVAPAAAEPGRPSTPAEVQAYLDATLTYQFDYDLYGRAEYFASPAETLARRAGDCEDWAWLAKSILDRAGYETVLFSAWSQRRDRGGNDGHTALAVFVDGAWDHLSNLGYVRARATSLEALAASVYPDWTRANYWRFDGPAVTANGWNGWRPVLWTHRGPAHRTTVAAIADATTGAR
jgi:hypothetical protein